MRLLFVHDRFGAMAGAEVNLHLTANELKARGGSVGILHGPGTGKNQTAWTQTFTERFALGSKSNQQITDDAIQAFNPDAIYVHKMADLTVLETLARSGVPVVRMVHDHDLYCLRSYKYFPFTRKICPHGAGWRCVVPCGAIVTRQRGGGFPLKWRSFFAKLKELRINRSFARMIVATDYMRQELLRNHFDPRRIEIHSPVPRTQAAADSSTFSDRNLIVYSGQIIRGKGVDVLLESLAKIGVPFECVILGDGHHRHYCERLSERLGLADRVTFKGYLPSAELAEFYADASVAAVSSVWPEPFGAVGLEAMRFGVPVVAFDAGGIREWLIDGENGFLVPWMDRAQFANRVEQLLRDKTLARSLGEKGKCIAREKFSFDQYIDGLERMFARVAARPQTEAVR
ncbi:MAG TPA: glycosyltransferase family 4 protein [Verrucomicrobiae bacterium]